MSKQTITFWIKHNQHPVARFTYAAILSARKFSLPVPKFICVILYWLITNLSAIWQTITRICLWTPAWRGRTEAMGTGLYLYSGMPQVTGSLRVIVGDNCRISGHSTFSGRSCAPHPPLLQLGDNIDIGWQTSISVATHVLIGDNVRIAGRCFLCGYPGHPLNPTLRAQGAPELDAQCGSIIIEPNVWLATGVTVMPDVRIGQGTIVAAGSVVTKSLPPYVLAAGVPAKVIRELTREELGV